MPRGVQKQFFLSFSPEVPNIYRLPSSFLKLRHYTSHYTESR
ncbi:hypothetical protein NXF25_005225 [Crotalus adamanteus]|uniref:Uncharacterized protein n=1 Tax=Crotalus adamanteus TaxID=8729 RepID=A0AAW1BX46_CROAD